MSNSSTRIFDGTSRLTLVRSVGINAAANAIAVSSSSKLIAVGCDAGYVEVRDLFFFWRSLAHAGYRFGNMTQSSTTESVSASLGLLAKCALLCGTLGMIGCSLLVASWGIYMGLHWLHRTYDFNM